MIESTEETVQEEIEIPEEWKILEERPAINEEDKMTTGNKMINMTEEENHHTEEKAMLPEGWIEVQMIEMLEDMKVQERCHLVFMILQLQ